MKFVVLFHILIGSVFSFYGSQGQTSEVSKRCSTALSQIETLSLSLPHWADYWDPGKEEDRYFDIAKLMSRFSLNRMEAVQTQVQYKLIAAKYPDRNPMLIFNEALALVRNGQYDHVDVAKLKEAKFIVVFDLDETAYDQRITKENSASADVKYKDAKGVDHYILTAPHIIEVFQEIVKLGGAVVLFSSNKDASTKANLTAWKLSDGQPLISSPILAAILTENALIFQGGEKGVVVASKDLRIFDEVLEKVIIVDDNPTRLFQWKNEKLLRTFDGNLYITTADPILKKSTEASLLDLMAEIREAAEFMTANPGTTMQKAFLPFTIPGQSNIQWLEKSGHFKSTKEIRDYIRMNSEIVLPRYP